VALKRFCLNRPARLLIRRRPAQQVAHFLLNRWMIMNGITWWSRVLTVVGVAGMLIGAIDPLEGSIIILPGSALVTL